MTAWAKSCGASCGKIVADAAGDQAMFVAAGELAA